MSLTLRSKHQISGNNLTTSQMILFHYINSKNSQLFKTRIDKHFIASKQSKEDAVIQIVKQIDDFLDGVTYIKFFKRPFQKLIKPLNYTFKPFLAVQTKGAATLVTDINAEERAFLEKFKNDLLCVFLK